MGIIRDWFGNKKHKKLTSGPHTGTGNSGKMTPQPKVTFRDSSGKVIQPKGKKRG